MKAKLEYIGEWIKTDFSESYNKAKEMGLDDLMEVIGVRGCVDLRILMAGYRTILGCYMEEDGSATYSLEVMVPLVGQEGEVELGSLDKAMSMLKDMKKKGYFLHGMGNGCINCYKSGSLGSLKKELEKVGEVLSQLPMKNL